MVGPRRAFSLPTYARETRVTAGPPNPARATDPHEPPSGSSRPAPAALESLGQTSRVGLRETEFPAGGGGMARYPFAELPGMLGRAGQLSNSNGPPSHFLAAHLRARDARPAARAPHPPEPPQAADPPGRRACHRGGGPVNRGRAGGCSFWRRNAPAPAWPIS